MWIGTQAETPEQLRPGQAVTYKLTVINNGDSPASQTVVTGAYDASHLAILGSSIPMENDGQGQLSWNLGTIPPGGAKELSYEARLVEADPHGSEITNTASVSSHETDNNLADNTDVVTITSAQLDRLVRSGSRINRSTLRPLANNTGKRLEVTRHQLVEVLDAEHSLSHQRLIIRNPSNTAYPNMVMHDTLKNLSGQVIKDTTWNLGKVLPRESIAIDYDIAFGTKAAPDIYLLNTAFVGLKSTNLPNGYILLKPTPLNLARAL